MDCSNNSGSISSSGGEEEYDSHAHHHHILNNFGSMISQSSMFDLSSSSTYLHAPSHSQTASLLNSDSTAEANCTDLPSSSSGVGTINQCLSGPQGLISHNVDYNARKLSSAPTNNNNFAVVVRNPKKRSRASRRAPTTVLTTDTTNFRSMVQEFTGIPAPPFSASISSSHLDTTSKKEIHPINPLLLLSSHSPSRLLHNNNMNYQLPPDLGLPYQQTQPQINMMFPQQNHPNINLSFHPSLPVGFGAKSSSQAGLAMPASLEDPGMNHGQQVNVHMVGTGVVSGHHEHGASSGRESGGARR
ncbi:hypothetical protein SESBI_24816 [Sesbania bispinosa]|nr:hypothetical protein SESBI_24816 [Sesbania bispinosa]